MKKILLIFILLIAFSHCKEHIIETKTVDFDTLNVKQIHFIDTKTVMGFPVGIDCERGYAFVQSQLKAERKFVIKIVDLGSGEIVDKLELTAGDFQSPTEFFGPNHIQFINDHYFVVDQFEKIAVFDNKFNHVYSSMFHQMRYFIDIFDHQNQTCFVIGTKIPGPNTKSEIHLYQLDKRHRPRSIMNIPNDFEILSLPKNDRKKKKKYLYHGLPWPAVSGFEKEGKIYYSIGNKKEYYVYDITEGYEKNYFLPYLKTKQYTDRDVEKLGHYKSDGWQEDLEKKYKVIVKYIAYPGETYHYGIYDIGTDKIGVATDLDMETMTFRLDVIDSRGGNYIESIRLPFNCGFRRSIYSGNRGLLRTFINIDMGIYVWYDTEGEDFVDTVKISRFEIK